MFSRVRHITQAWLVAALSVYPIAASSTENDEWITINKDYSSQRYVDLDQINARNVGELKQVCEIQLNEPAWFNSGLLKVGRTLYVTTLRSTYAVDATTCELRWRHDIQSLGRIANVANRGPGYWGGMIFRGTVDGRVIALDAKTGKLVWDVQSADPTRSEGFIAAPIAWDGKVFIGICTSDLGVRGRIKALDAKTGKELWRFYTIPIGTQPGAETWHNAAVVTPAGGGFWSSYSLDPATNEVFGPVANPYPDYVSIDTRPGDNLYTNSVIALNAATGKLNWYHQATPGDQHDWDLGTPPTLYRTTSGKNMLAIAGKDGHVLGIDRTSKTVVFKTPGTTIANDGPVDDTLKLVCPGSIGGAQWNGTAYHPGIGVLYTGMVDWCFYYSTKTYTGGPAKAIEPDGGYPGGWKETGGTMRADFSHQPKGWITAMDGETGRVLWKYHTDAQVIAGLVPTKAGLLFAGDTRGNLFALDAKNGSVLKRIDARGALNNGLISYAVDGTQYVAAAVGGLTLNCAGVSGPLRVSVYGLHGSETPKMAKLDRTFALGTTSGAGLFALVCGPCHGSTGQGGSFPSLVRHTQLTEPEKLKAFLKSVPPPMPILYPGLLEDHDVELIAEHMKVITAQPNQEPPAKPPASEIPSVTPAKTAYQAPASGDTGSSNVAATQLQTATGPSEWEKVYSVFSSPRCVNCHTATEYPRQTDSRYPHVFSVVRGLDDKGTPVARCTACHGNVNDVANGIPGAPDWHKAPLAMALESTPGVVVTSVELCTQIKDPLRNGSRDLAKVAEHLEADPVLRYSWNPGTRWNGEARTTPPVSHEEFVKAFKDWVAAGAVCPTPSTNVIQASNKK